MQKPRASRWFSFTISTLCVAQAIYIYMTAPASPEPTEIISVIPVNSTGAIYEVLYNSGGATVPIVYRYFLMKRDDNHTEALNKIKSAHPFLVTKSSGAVREILPGRVKLRTLDMIYEYRNTAYYETNGEWKRVKLDLTSDMP
ncbi:hypothetical protein [Pseudomonas sp. G2-4]|uniref:hypothetical protein n=1 Tax=Pseudomonas sp. G2-4 TaxID=1506334 RepID=UPI0024B8DD9C|nr:hypothetical protein [Pseudomonas sp. G2-4]WHS62387.1 hypothetical protein QNH97_10225 [Pseudomonas sp. G2-4]